MVTTGLSYPLEYTTDGNLATVSDASLIATQIVSLLETEPGESPMRPEYGTPTALFESQPNNVVYASTVRRQLVAEIPQATFEVQSVVNDDAELLLTIDWTYNGEIQPSITATV